MKKLYFQDNNFKILHITDVHQSLKMDGDTLRLMEGVLEHEKFDLVIFTGDQLKGYSPAFRGGDPEEKVETALDNLLKPIIKRNIPFSVTFGNHDRQTGVPNKRQWEMLFKYPNFIAGDILMNAGTTCILLHDEKINKPIFSVYLIDSGTSASSGGYEAVSPQQIQWFTQNRKDLMKKYGTSFPAMVFQHIPMQEYYNAMKKANKKDKFTIKGYRKFSKNKYKLPNPENGELIGEQFCCPDENTGEFDALKNDGNVLAVFCGHDHKNSFIRPYKGIDLGYTQGFGFNEYGPGTMRGARVITLNKNQPSSYTSKTITYENLFGKKTKNLIKNFFYKYLPTSKEQALEMLLKLIIISGSIAVIIIIIKKIISAFL